MYIVVKQTRLFGYRSAPPRPFAYYILLVKSERVNGKPRQIHITSLSNFLGGNKKDGKIPANGGFDVWKEEIEPTLLKAKETGKIRARDGYIKIDITDKDIEKLKQSIKDKFLYWDETGEWWDIVPE